MIRTHRLIVYLLIVGIGVSSLSFGQRNRRPKIELLREIDPEEGRQRMAGFRQMWVIGDFSLKYSLQYIPRRGKRSEILGTLWTSNGNDGPVSQISIHGAAESQLYLRNGPFASVFQKKKTSSEWVELGTDEWFESIDPQVTLTPFDLMMPYIYWPDWTYEGVTKIRGRVAHAFLMEAPETLNGNPIGLHGVVVFLDEDFNALLKADYVSEDEGVLKSFRLLDLKKVNEVWLPKTVDFLNEETRDKTRLVIKEAAVNQDFRYHSLGKGELPGHVPEIPISDYIEVR